MGRKTTFTLLGYFVPIMDFRGVLEIPINDFLKKSRSYHTKFAIPTISVGIIRSWNGIYADSIYKRICRSQQNNT